MHCLHDFPLHFIAKVKVKEKAGKSMVRCFHLSVVVNMWAKVVLFF